MPNYSRMTELDAVNAMLRAIGEMPVQDLEEDTEVSEASIARGILHEVSRDVQDQGLECNEEFDFPLVPDTLGSIYLPENLLRVDPFDISQNYVQRGNRLYDKDEHTFAIGKTVSCHVIWFLPFDELPQHAQAWIAIQAVRRFVGDVLGDNGIKRLSDEEYTRIKAQFMRSESAADDETYLGSPGVWEALRRTR